MRVALCAVLVVLVGCKSSSKPSSSGPVNSAGGSGSTAVVESQEPKVVEGVVADTIDAGNYTYLSLTTTNGEVWAAVPKAVVSKGDKVAVERAVAMHKFHSPTMGREFEKIYFGVLRGKAAHGRPMPEPAVAIPSEIKVEKASGVGAVTVQEVWDKAEALRGKEVVLQVVVVKVNTGILERNWVHVQDGTGDRGKKNNDLLVTTKAVPKVGDTVQVRGKVATDKDFGSGYSYKVLVEDAEVKAGTEARMGK